MLKLHYRYYSVSRSTDMPSIRLSQRQRRRRVDNPSATAATRVHASTEGLPLTSSYLHRIALVVLSVLTSADPHSDDQH